MRVCPRLSKEGRIVHRDGGALGVRTNCRERIEAAFLPSGWGATARLGPSSCAPERDRPGGIAEASWTCWSG